MSPPQQPCGTDSTTLANRHIAAAMEKGTDRFEWVHRRVDNSETFHAEVLLNAMELDGKRVLQAVVRDITERKRAEDALRASELKYRTLVRHIPQRIVYKDRESVFVSCNDLFARDLGIPAAEIAGKTDFDIHPRELAEKYRADDRRVMDSGETLEFEEERAINGVVRTVFSVRTPVIGEKGEVIGVLVVFTDVTERKRAELALRLAERQLLQSQKLESVGQLAAGIAHEINTPIQYVGDNANFLEQAFRDLAPFLGSHERIVRALRDSPESEFAGELERQLQEADVDYLRDEVPRAIGQLTEGVEQVARIVRAMKEFSHPGPVERTFLDLNHAIESTILVSRNEWKHVADLTADLDPALPPVPCLAGEINQVVLNLIVNAAHAIGDVMKATGQKGVIHVSTRHHEAWAEIRVRDTGTGIPEAIQSKVFDPFFTTKQVGKGTGQGLSIAHGVIVKRHGGRISFETQVGAGTTFLIQLPLENREQP
jgi:PAS domain S-box-containing protein